MKEFYVRTKEDNKIYKAARVEWYNVPTFLTYCEIKKNCDGSWSINTPNGEKTGMPEESYWIYYGENPDGTPNGDIITKEEFINKFYFCDKKGN